MNHTVRKFTDETVNVATNTAKHPVTVLSILGTLLSGGGMYFSLPHIEERLWHPFKEFVVDQKALVQGIIDRQDIIINQNCNGDSDCVEEEWETLVIRKKMREIGR